MTAADLVAEALRVGCEGTSVSPEALARFECVQGALAHLAAAALGGGK